MTIEPSDACGSASVDCANGLKLVVELEDSMRRLTAQSGLLIVTLALCAAGLPGCANLRLPQIDPSGERLFICPENDPRAAFRDLPATDKPSNRTELIVCPRATVAPIGSEVILLAGVRGPDQYLRTNERVEWMIDPGGVGQFVDLDKGSWTDPLVGDFTRAKKIDNTYAVNTTSRRLLRLTRGTPDKSDDMDVLKGQAWVTLTSASEGTSNVTVYCPGVSPWEARTESCQVHWIDAQWSFPSVAIAQSGGRQLLTTSVTRQSDRAPRRGWIVRYEIVDGPPAGFAPDGSQVVEISTDEQGNAAVELFQRQAQAGTSKVSIQVIRPAGLGCPDQRIVIGRTCLAQTWSAPALAVRVTGSSAGSVGANLGFRVEVSNPGDMAAEGISLTLRVPPGLSCVSASPTFEGAGSAPRWSMGRLAPGEVRSIALDLRAERAGRYEVCADAVAASGLSASGCANLAVDAAELTVEVLGPTEAKVGDSVTHRIVVTNPSRAAATALILTDSRDAGLEHNIRERKIFKSLGDLGPMQSQEVTITFRAIQPGRQCHTVQVTGAGGLRADGRACIEVREAPVPSPVQPSPGGSGWNEPESPVPSPATPPAGPSLPRLEINASFAGDEVQQLRVEEAREGDSVVLMLDVSSPDGLALEGLTLSMQLDPLFAPLQASKGYTRDGNTFTWRSFAVDPGISGQVAVGRVAVLCRCEQASSSACFTATVSDAGGQTLTRQACIPIRAAAPPAGASQAPPAESTAGLQVSLYTTQQPVSQGSTFSYQVIVSNQAYADDQNVELAIAFPAGLTPQQWGSRGDSRVRVRNNVVYCDTVPELRARGQLNYTIEVTADEVGEHTVRADARSANQPGAVSQTGVIKVNLNKY